jgi:hypothetical protein
MALFSRQLSPFGGDVPEELVRESFLGTLRSELDDDVTLDGAFAELLARFSSLRDSYMAGRLEAKAFGRLLRDLRVLDGDGFQWTVGASTGRWYRRNVQDGGQWMAAPAPGRGGGMLVDASGQASGWAVEDWDERRAKRLREQAEKARFDEEIRSTQPVEKRRITIDEMFDKYIEQADDSDISIESTILAVDDTNTGGNFGVLPNE